MNKPKCQACTAYVMRTYYRGAEGIGMYEIREELCSRGHAFGDAEKCGEYEREPGSDDDWDVDRHGTGPLTGDY